MTRLGLIFYYPTLLLALVGGVELWRRRRRVWWVLVVPAIVVTIGVASTYGQTRFRAAAEPSLALFAAVGIVTLVRAAAARRAKEPARDPGPAVTCDVYTLTVCGGLSSASETVWCTAAGSRVNANTATA